MGVGYRTVAGLSGGMTSMGPKSSLGRLPSARPAPSGTRSRSCSPRGSTTGRSTARCPNRSKAWGGRSPVDAVTHGTIDDVAEAVFNVLEQTITESARMWHSQIRAVLDQKLRQPGIVGQYIDRPRFPRGRVHGNIRSRRPSSGVSAYANFPLAPFDDLAVTRRWPLPMLRERCPGQVGSRLGD